MKTCFLIVVLASATHAQLLPRDVPAAPSSSATPIPQAADIGPDTVVATVAGIGVTVSDVRKMMENAPQALNQLFQKDPRQAIQQIYEMKHFASEGAKLGLDEKEPLKSELEALKQILTENVLASALVNEEYNRYEVTGDMIDDFYQKNRSRWEEANIKIILLGFKPAPLPGSIKPNQTTEEALEAAAKAASEGAHPLNERTEAEALKLASDLVARLRKGEDFAALVTKYSDDAESKTSGGDFGTPIKANSSFDKDLKKVVFDLKDGEISEPVRQGNGFYIIRLESKTVQPINDVRSSIVKEIRDKHQDLWLNENNKLFTPQIQRPEFFAQPGRYLSPGPTSPSSPTK